MRKTVIFASALLITPMVSNAAETGPGCGVGAMIFDGQTGLAQHVLAATTNGILGNQTFGMTSGTLGCDTTQTITTAAADEFLNSNIDKIAKEMATGQGENLATLASLLGIDDQDKSVFFQVTQENFSKIFRSSETTSVEALVSLKAVMQLDSTLVKYVI